MVNSVKEIKKVINEVMLPGYKYTTNFSNGDFLIDINYNLIISAKPIRYEDKVEYEFVLDMQFAPNKDITVSEIKMINKIIDILEENRNFVIKRFKKYTVEEYDREQEERRIKSEKALEELKKMMAYSINRKYGIDINKDDFEY